MIFPARRCWTLPAKIRRGKLRRRMAGTTPAREKILGTAGLAKACSGISLRGRASQALSSLGPASLFTAARRKLYFWQNSAAHWQAWVRRGEATSWPQGHRIFAVGHGLASAPLAQPEHGEASHPRKGTAFSLGIAAAALGAAMLRWSLASRAKAGLDHRGNPAAFIFGRGKTSLGGFWLGLARQHQGGNAQDFL